MFGSRNLLIFAILAVVLGVFIVVVRENMILSSLLVLVLVGMVMLLLYRVGSDVKLLGGKLERIVNGQLSVNIGSAGLRFFKDIGGHLNKFLGKIRNLLARFTVLSEKTTKESRAMERLAENLKTTAGEIASTVQNISEAVNNQAESTAKVKENIESFSNGMNHIQENARNVLEAANNSGNVVDESFQTLRDVFKKIEEVKEFNEKLLNDIMNLNESMKQVGEITEAVENISSKTHLLALNASIEAARAGVAGRSFAVVAEEVGDLADESSRFAKKIRELIKGTIEETDGLSRTVKKGTEVVEGSVTSADEALEKSEDITKAVEKNKEAAEAIVKLIDEQKSKIDDITRAMEVINDGTQQNAAVVEEITASTQEQLSIIENMYESAVNLGRAIEDSNEVISDFMRGFKITEEMKGKIEKVKSLLMDLGKVEGLAGMEKSEIDKLLKEKQDTLDYLELVALINHKGILQAAGTNVEYMDCSAREYFQKAISGETFVSKEYISILTNNYNITVSTPVYEGGKIAGILMADININED